uniref:FAD binding domain-containing protein n=1 Tax=Enterocloster asparagiformis TaxID=333367 RepID=UPI002A83356A
LKQIGKREQMILIGAGVTHNQAAASALVQADAACLAQASSMVGSNQIRNSSTLAGNVVNAQPAADSAVALVALGAKARILTGREEEIVPVEGLYAGFGKSRVDSSRSILTCFLVPAEAGTGSGYVRLQQRKALALPMLCVAAWIRREDGVVRDARIAMAPVGVGPVRAVEAEGLLLGREGGDALWTQAGELALKNANPRDSLVRGSRKYRLEVLPVLVQEALSIAWEDAGRKEEAHG